MRLDHPRIFSIFSAAALLSCTTPVKPPRIDPDTRERVSWYQNMHKLAFSLTEMLPLVMSDQEFAAPKNQARITSITHELAKAAQNVNESRLPPNQDPGISFVSTRFRDDVLEASKLLDLNKSAQARNKLRHLTRYCVSCHTMTHSNTQFAIASSIENFSWSALEKAEYYAATRQWDLAIQAYEHALTDPTWANTHPSEWEDGIQKLLAIVARVKNNPSLTLEMVSRFFDSDSYPTGLSEYARVWRKNIKTWRDQDLKKKHPLSRKDNFELGKHLVGAFTQSTSAKDLRFEFILYLRASSYFHEYLKERSNNPRDTEALYLAGVTAERLANLNFWTLPEDYFEACIRRTPDSEWAAQCFSRLEAINPHSQEPLNELRTLMKRN